MFPVSLEESLLGKTEFIALGDVNEGSCSRKAILFINGRRNPQGMCLNIRVYCYALFTFFPMNSCGIFLESMTHSICKFLPRLRDNDKWKK